MGVKERRATGTGEMVWCVTQQRAAELGQELELLPLLLSSLYPASSDSEAQAQKSHYLMLFYCLDLFNSQVTLLTTTVP